MVKSLGVFVSSDQHLDKIIKLCKAAKKKEIEVNIFFTHQGILLTKDPRFAELDGLANMSLCRVGFEGYGFKPPVPGINEKGYDSQIRHGEMIKECDRYMVF